MLLSQNEQFGLFLALNSRTITGINRKNTYVGEIFVTEPSVIDNLLQTFDLVIK